MAKKSKSKRLYLYLCDNYRRIKDGKCDGTGCLIFNNCVYTAYEHYAKNPKENRIFEYFCTYDADGNINNEFYFEIEKGSVFFNE